MAEYPVKRPLRRPPTHSGAILRQDVLPALGLSVAEAARRLGVSRQQLLPFSIIRVHTTRCQGGVVW